MAAAEPDPLTFPALLKQCRLAAGLTQEELAERAGLSARGVSDLERGLRQQPRQETVRMLADALALAGEPRAHFEAIARRPATGAPTAEAGRHERRSRLPAPLTPFIGREEEIATATALLRRDGVRLLTLTGPGGIGKTRLALRVAAILEASFDDGVHFIDFAALDDRHRVLPTIARALGIQETPEQNLWDDLVDRLSGKRAVLVLDTFEHVTSAGVDLTDLLVACPSLTILVTSREPLRLRAERQLPTPPFATPDPRGALAAEDLADVPSVALFVDRAQAVRHDFALSPETAPIVARICQRLGGVPLAIELAAARLGTFSLAELQRRLDESVALLSEGPRDLPARQQSLWATLAWSYRTLAHDEQSLLRHLAVFSGGGATEAVAMIAGGAANGHSELGKALAALVAGHLVQAETAPDGTTRYRLGDVIHEFADDLAAGGDEMDAARARHAAYFLDLAEAAGPDLEGPRQRLALARLEADHDNLRAALAWSIDVGAVETALRLASALWPFWETRGYFTEGRSWLERALALPGQVEPATRARALLAAAGLAEVQGDYDRAIALYEQAIAQWQEAGDRSGLARALNNLGIVFDNRSEFDRAAELYAEALALHRELGEPDRIAAALNNLGVVAYTRGDYEESATFHEESLALRRQAGDTQGIAASLTNAAAATSGMGDEARAEALLAEALTLYRSLGDPAGIAGVLLNLGMIAYRRADLAEAAGCYGEALALQRRLGDKYMTAMLLNNLATVAARRQNVADAVAQRRESLALRQLIGDRVGVGECLVGFADSVALAGDPERAVGLVATAEAMFERVGHAMHPAERAELNRGLITLRSALGETAFLAAFERGRSRPIEAAIGDALAFAANGGHGGARLTGQTA